MTLVRSDRALTDCRPVSLISLQTIRQLEGELGTTIDQRRFRANVYLTSLRMTALRRMLWLAANCGSVRRGDAVLERDPRCKMISLDPDTGEHNPEVFRKSPKLTAPLPAFIAPFWWKGC